MSQTCPNCGSLNRATNRFCSNCGTPLVPAAGNLAETPQTAPAGQGEPVTYVVQTWDAPASHEEPADEEKVVASPRPTFLPYGGFLPTASTGQNSQGTGYSGEPTVAIAPAAPPPVTPDRSEGGAYSPYSPEVARRLETRKSNRSWLLPSVGAAAVLLAVLVLVGGYLLFSQNSGSSATDNHSAAGGSAATSDSGNDTDNIKKVIKQSNDEQITAWRNLDTEVLKGTRTGQVLQDNIQAVQELRDHGMYAIPVNKSLQFGEITVSGNTATAKTVEVWTVTFYSKNDNKVVNSTGPDTLYETYHLVKQDGKWFVSSLDIVPNSAPATPGANNT